MGNIFLCLKYIDKQNVVLISDTIDKVGKRFVSRIVRPVCINRSGRMIAVRVERKKAVRSTPLGMTAFRGFKRSYTIFLLKTRQMCYTVSGDENEEIRDNH